MRLVRTGSGDHVQYWLAPSNTLSLSQLKKQQLEWGSLAPGPCTSRRTLTPELSILALSPVRICRSF